MTGSSEATANGETMNKTLAVLVMTVLSSAILAGCIGGGGFGGSGAPTAVVSVTEVADKEHTFRFDASGSSGSGLSYDWDLGDGTTATDAVVEHTYEYGSGTYPARLVIEDDAGTPDVWEGEIEVGDGSNEPPVAFFKLKKRNFAIDEPVRVDASGSWDPDGDPLTYRWDFNHLMDFDEYMAFRADRAQALEGVEEDGGGPGGSDPDGKSSGGDLVGPPYDALRERDPTGLLGNKHAGHGDDGKDIDASLFSHTAETDEPVYTLEEGFPDETTFFIRLRAYDVKGAHEEIVSEEIWPVEVFKNPPESFISDNTSGTFDFGAPAEVTDAINDSGLGGEDVQFEYTWEFEVDWPVAPSKRDGLDFVPGGQITVRWEAESDATPAPSSIDMTVTTPNGEEQNGFALESSQGHRVELDGNNDYVDGKWDTPWKVHIIARDGVELSWDLDYWMNLDTNPFFEIEGDYV